MAMKRLMKTRLAYNKIEAEAISNYESLLSQQRKDFSIAAVKLNEKKEKLFKKGNMKEWELDQESLPDEFNPLEKSEAQSYMLPIQTMALKEQERTLWFYMN